MNAELPTLVLIHAFPLAGRMWDAARAELADQFEILTPDVAGFGAAPPAAWTVDRAAEELLADLDRHGVGRAIVGGCSMGGYIALALACRHPDRLSGLILTNTRADADSPEARESRGVNLELVRTEGTAALVEKMLPRLLGVTTHQTRPDVVAAVRSLGNAQSTEAVSAGLVALRDRPDRTEELQHLMMPTLVIAGAEDELIPPSLGESLAARVPDARFVTLPESGHLAPLEAPSAWAGVVRDWVKTVGLTAGS